MPVLTVETSQQRGLVKSENKKNNADLLDGTIEQMRLYARILAWDLSREKSYCANRWGYKNTDYLDEMELAYKRYIFLVCSYHELSLPASERFDDMWHAHILNLRNYVQFCDATFGRLIYHNPTISDVENVALMPKYKADTLRVYERHFGEPNEFWIAVKASDSCCTH